MRNGCGPILRIAVVLAVVSPGATWAGDPGTVPQCTTFAAPVIYPGDRLVALADFNGDQKLDVVDVSHSGSENTDIDRGVVRLGVGDGTFGAAGTPFSTGGTSRAVTTADINGDGLTDLVVANLHYGSAVLLGNGDGIFGAPLLTDVSAISAAVGDFNQDGDADLALAQLSGDVAILLGNGNGTFDAGVSYDTGRNSRGVAVGDFNEDGKSDLAVSNYDSDNTSILLGNGDGTFSPAVNYPSGNGSNEVVIEDFNSDGNQDLAVANKLSVSILAGNGDGTFDAAVKYFVDTRTLAVADFNGDGLSDLVTVPYGGASASIILGNGDGTFTSPVTFNTGGDFSVAVGDINADGAPDLAFGGVSILIAGCPDLNVTKSHTGNFTQGQSGATFTITVANAGTAMTNGTVTVTDTPSAGLTITAMTGPGWGCTLATLTCTRSDGLAQLASYQPITVTANVSSTAPATVTNSAHVSGGREVDPANNDAEDTATVGSSPDLAITKTHTGDFAKGRSGTYTITVRNGGGAETSGTVTVIDTLPAGLTATSIGGDGWNCTLEGLTCSRSDVLQPEASFPAITLAVTVDNTAQATVVNSATVSVDGETFTGNNTASDSTTILMADLTVTKTHEGNFTQGKTGTYTITVRNLSGAPTSDTVRITDTLPAGMTAAAISGPGWTCTLGNLRCTRTDALAVGEAYPPVTVTVNVAANAPDSVVNKAVVALGGDGSPGNNTANDTTFVLGTPTNLAATAIATTQVSLTWSAAARASRYQVLRSSENGPFSVIAQPSVTNFTDQGLTAGTTYVYVVKATDDVTLSQPSNADIATTILFTDDPILQRATLVKVEHVSELRTAVNAVRTAAGLMPASYTDALTSGIIVKAIHLTELRSSLDQARSLLGLPALSYTDAALQGMPIRAAHMRELRSGVK